MYYNFCILGFYFFFNDPATTDIYTYGHTLSLHDALPIYAYARTAAARAGERGTAWSARRRRAGGVGHAGNASGPRAGELHRDSAAVGDDHDCRHPFGAAGRAAPSRD